MNTAKHYSIFDNILVGDIFRLRLDHKNTQLMLHRDGYPEAATDIRELGFPIPDRLIKRVMKNFPPSLFGIWLSGAISRSHGSQLSIALVESRVQGWESLTEILDRHALTKEFVFVVNPAPTMVNWDRFTCRQS